MKKLLLLLICNVVISATTVASGFYILQMYIEPTNPSANDSVKVVFYLYSSNQPCNNLNQSVVINDSTIVIKRCKMTGAFDAGCWEYDSVNLGKFPIGNYHISYFLNHVTWNNPNDSSCSSFTQPVDTAYLDFTVSYPNALEPNVLETDMIRLVPNPATDQLSITTKNITANCINIYNITGVLVLTVSRPTQNCQIQITALPAGTYLAEIITEHTTIKKKWIKM